MELEELEKRVRRLKEKREEIRGTRKEVSGEGKVEVEGEVELERGEGSPRVPRTGEEDDDEEDEEDDWDGWGLH